MAIKQIKNTNTIDDVFPFDEATNIQLFKKIGKTPEQIICPLMQTTHLCKSESRYLVYGTCKYDYRECQYNPEQFSTTECQTLNSFNPPDPTKDHKYAIFCLGK
jgi:hypothetical protein